MTTPQQTSSSLLAENTPWFAISMGLLGLIVGFGLHRFTPRTFGAQATISPPAVQGLVVQPSATPPPPDTGGGGCGCGGGGGSCGAKAANPT